MEVAMDRVTFDRFARRAVCLCDRRSLFGGLGATLLAIAGVPLAAGAKKGKRNKGNKNKNKRTKACKKRVKDCRQEVLPGCEDTNDPAGCEDVVNRCCKKACKSVNAARECLADNL
jgi:hypothetical protein